MEDSIAKKIVNGGIGVIPTDTLYGLVASAFNRDAIERIYAVRKRNLKKPCIILISALDDLVRFGIELVPETRLILKEVWPGPVSVILQCDKAEFEYLHRGTKTIAFRLPSHEKVVTLLNQTGPLIAPSANLEGSSPATTIDESRSYFGDQVDFYVDGGVLDSVPSRVVRVEGANLVFIR